MKKIRIPKNVTAFDGRALIVKSLINNSEVFTIQIRKPKLIKSEIIETK